MSPGHQTGVDSGAPAVPGSGGAWGAWTPVTSISSVSWAPTGWVSSAAAGWGAWGAWSSCSAPPSCRGGRKVTRRRCRTQACPGASKQIQLCNKVETLCTSQGGPGPGGPVGPHGGGPGGPVAPVAPTTITPPSASCPQRKVRKNVRTLSEEEKRALVEAMRRAMASGALQQVMGLHGVPADTTICGTRGNSVPCCPHDENWPAFLPWHRNYMVQLEEVLGLPLPYWDWTEDSSWPNLFEPILKDIHDNAGIDVIAGLNEFGTAGQCDPANPGGLDAYRARQRGIAHSNFLQEQPNFKRQIGLAFIKENYREFSSQLSNPHNMVHNTNPCNLRPTLVAAWDPVFFLHHAFVDMQYAYWQVCCVTI